MKQMHVFLSLAVALLFAVKKNQVIISFEVNYANHTEIFDHLSKIENFSVLNPTIYRIELVNGNEEEFTILYDECLSNFPSITNSGTAHYKLVRSNGNGDHELHSIHSTCFANKYFCLYTTAVLRINLTDRSTTYYEESIRYDCPWILTAFCLNEIFFQRMTIANGLENVFGEIQT